MEIDPLPYKKINRRKEESEKMLKKSVKIILTVFCLLFVAVSAVSVDAAETTQTTQSGQTTVKKGLVKEKGKYYFYEVKEDGTSARIKNKWKNVKDAKTKKTYRYYFGKDGAAYAGSKDMFGRKKLAVKKIGGKQYGFDTNARMIKGVAASYLNSGEKLYAFNSKTGVYDVPKTKKIRKAYGYEKKAAPLKQLLGQPKKIKKGTGCYGNGKEYLLYYDNFVLSTGETAKGVEVIFGVM